MATIPLASLDCTRLQFQPGDRILVKTVYRLDADQQRKLIKTIRKWAGCPDIEVLVVWQGEMDVTIMDRRVSTRIYPEPVPKQLVVP